MRRQSRNLLIFFGGSIAILGLIFLCFSPALQGSFVLDDDVYVPKESLLDVQGLKSYWLDYRITKHKYYPLLHTLFWIETKLFGPQAFVYHLTNILIHTLNAFLIWRILTLFKIRYAWWMALFFALHPVQVESVAWIAQRKNLLSLFFYLLSMLSFFRFYQMSEDPTNGISRQNYGLLPSLSKLWFYGLSIFFFLCSLLCKPGFVVLPAALLLLIWWKKNHLELRDFLGLLPHFIICTGFILSTIYLEKTHVGASGSAWAYSFLERILIAGRALWFYAGKLFWPVELCFIYPKWSIDLTDPIAYLYPVGFMVTVVLLWWKRPQWGNGPLVAVLFFTLHLLPVLGLIDFYLMRYTFVADHYLYFSSLGLLVGVISFVMHYGPWRNRMVAVPWAILVIIPMGLLTYRQCQLYKNETVFYQDIIQKNPSCWLAYINLGNVYARQGKIEDAISLFHQALFYNPDYAHAYYNLGTIFAVQKGKSQNAIAAFQKAIALDPHFAVAFHDLGKIYAREGLWTKAREAYQKALAADQDNISIHFSLAAAYIEEGLWEKAQITYQKILSLNPNEAKAHHNLGVIYTEKGLLKEAFAEFSYALSLNPFYAQAHYNRGLIYEKQGQFQMARESYQQALQIKPHFSEAIARLDGLP